MEQQNNSNNNKPRKKRYKHYYNKKKHNSDNQGAENVDAVDVLESVNVENSDVEAKNTNESARGDKNDGNFKSGNKHRRNRNRNKNKNRNQDPLPSVEPSQEVLEEHPEPADAIETVTYEEVMEASSGAYEIPDDEIFGEDAKDAVEDNEEKVEVIGIRFRKAGKIYYFDPSGFKAIKGGAAIVETARGPEFGEIMAGNKFVKMSEIVLPLRPVIRLATEEDILHNEDNRKKEDEAFTTCVQKIKAHDLDMKLIDAQYTFDNSKLLFYFTSAGRVDFRDLVKDLASVFKTRIELRQIGIRDEAKLMGGLGICGRPLCCSTFLSDFVQVSIKMAKEQNLSLNSTKISGNCGRLMCCLRYEYDVYAEEIRLTPSVDSTVKTPDGIGTVTEISPLSGTVKVRLKDKPDVQPKAYHRDNVKVLSAAKKADDGEN